MFPGVFTGLSNSWGEEGGAPLTSPVPAWGRFLQAGSCSGIWSKESARPESRHSRETVWAPQGSTRPRGLPVSCPQCLGFSPNPGVRVRDGAPQEEVHLGSAHTLHSHTQRGPAGPNSPKAPQSLKGSQPQNSFRPTFHRPRDRKHTERQLPVGGRGGASKINSLPHLPPQGTLGLLRASGGPEMGWAFSRSTAGGDRVGQEAVAQATGKVSGI